MEKYKLLKDIDSPTIYLKAGQIRTSSEWACVLDFKDVTDKKEWFDEVEEPTYTKQDLLDFGMFVRKKDASSIVLDEVYVDEWIESKTLRK